MIKLKLKLIEEYELWEDFVCFISVDEIKSVKLYKGEISIHVKILQQDIILSTIKWKFYINQANTILFCGMSYNLAIW